MELTLIIIISLAISFTWLFYFYKIDVFEREKLKHITLTFILGSIIPFVIYPLHTYVFRPLNIHQGNDVFSSFLFFTIGVGLVEETIKLIPLIIVIYFFRKELNEPLDYVLYICVSALGFAFGENIEYALNYGHHVLIVRSILSVPAHMFFSALFVYGYIEYKYNSKPKSFVVLFLVLGMLAHGIYDFLLELHLPFLSSLLNVIFFFLCVEAFVTIINNCLNNSPFHTPKKVIDQVLIRKILVNFYVPIIILTLIVTVVFEDAATALGSYMFLMFWQVSILLVIIVRLSRLSIMPKQWNPIRVSFPFHYKNQNNSDDFMFLFGILTIKGEGYNNAKISSFYQEEIKVVPLSKKQSYLNKVHIGIIEKKLFQNETVFYLLKIYLDETKNPNNVRHFLLKAKTKGITHTEEDNPIVSLNTIDKTGETKLVFKEWVILKKFHEGPTNNLLVNANIKSSPTLNDPTPNDGKID